MAAVPVPLPPLLASHAAVRAAASAVSHSRRVCLAGNHPPQVAALRRGDWVKLICGTSFEGQMDRNSGRPASASSPSDGPDNGRGGGPYALYAGVSLEGKVNQDAADVRNLSLVYTLAGGTHFDSTGRH